MAQGIAGSLIILLKTVADVTALKKVDNTMKKTTRTAMNLHRVFKGISLMGLFYGGQRALGSYLEFEKNLGAVQSRLFAITGDTQKASQEFDHIRKITKQLGLDLYSTADAYSIFFAGSARTLGTEGAQQMFDSWSKIGRVLHLTPYQMERVTYALREMSSKGTIYAQDLKMQLGTHVPDAVGIATEAINNLGINGVKTFEDFQKKSKGDLQLISQFLKEFTKVAEQRFASPEALKKAMGQPDALAGLITAQVQDMKVLFSQAGGREATIKILRGIYEGLVKIDIKALAQDFALLVNVLSNLVAFLGKSLPILFTLIKHLIIALTLSTIKNKLWTPVVGKGKLLRMDAGWGGKSAFFYFKRGLPIALGIFGRRFVKPLLTGLFRLFGGWWGILGSLLISAGFKFIPLLVQKLIDWYNLTFKAQDSSEVYKIIENLNKAIKENPELLKDEDIKNKILNTKFYTKEGKILTPTIIDNSKVTINGAPIHEDSKEDIQHWLQEAEKERKKLEHKNRIGILRNLGFK